MTPFEKYMAVIYFMLWIKILRLREIYAFWYNHWLNQIKNRRPLILLWNSENRNYSSNLWVSWESYHHTGLMNVNRSSLYLIVRQAVQSNFTLKCSKLTRMTLYLLKMPPALPPSRCSRIVLCIYRTKQNNFLKICWCGILKTFLLFSINILILLYCF